MTDSVTKKCTKCSEVKPIEQFYNTSRGRLAWCSECQSAYSRAYYHKDVERGRERNRKNYNPEKSRLRAIRNRYGLSAEQYQALLDANNGLCYACDGPPYGKQSLHVDHDHSCCPGKTSCGECIRGMLCSRCNRTLGAVNDDPKLLKLLIKYLKENNETH